MDEIDHRLIALLRENARTPVSALAQRPEVSRGTAQNRMARLEEQGIIVGPASLTPRPTLFFPPTFDLPAP